MCQELKGEPYESEVERGAPVSEVERGALCVKN